MNIQFLSPDQELIMSRIWKSIKLVFIYIDYLIRFDLPDNLIKPLQLCPEVPPLDVKVQHPCVIHKHTEGYFRQVCCSLPQNLVHLTFCVSH